MRIGIDLDNTIVSYDEAYNKAAYAHRLVNQSSGLSKSEVKALVQASPLGDRAWQELQGKVYGPHINDATLMPNVARFLVRCKLRGDDVFIVSHKTEFGHFDETKTPLREAALGWMRKRRFFDPRYIGMMPENIFFAATRAEKVAIIKKLDLDVMIDDLVEVFKEDGFPNIQKILFTPTSNEIFSQPNTFSMHVRFQSWQEIDQEINGILSEQHIMAFADTILGGVRIASAEHIGRGGNSAVYKISDAVGQTYALKLYPDRSLDPRNRQHTERLALLLTKAEGVTPNIVAFDEGLNATLFDWIEGYPITKVENAHIDAMIKFVTGLHMKSSNKTIDKVLASEACLCLQDLIGQIEKRLKSLIDIQSPALQALLTDQIIPTFKVAHERAVTLWPVSNQNTALDWRYMTLSPSDFGTHNAIQRQDGCVAFVDFEYFGFDDPVKLIADILWHQGMELTEAQKYMLARKLCLVFDQDKELVTRLQAAWPLFGIRWALIVLNEFHPRSWELRRAAMLEANDARDEIQARQLDKARSIINSLSLTKLRCVYV